MESPSQDFCNSLRGGNMNTPMERFNYVFGRCGYKRDVQIAQACGFPLNPRTGKARSSTISEWRKKNRTPQPEVVDKAFQSLAAWQPWIQNPSELAKWVRNGGQPPAWLELDDTTDPRRKTPQAAAAPVVLRAAQAFDGTAALSLAVAHDAQPVRGRNPAVAAYRQSIEEFVRAGLAEKAKELMADLFGPVLGPEIVAVLDGNNFLTVTANGKRPLGEIVPLVKKTIEDHYSATG